MHWSGAGTSSKRPISPILRFVLNVAFLLQGYAYALVILYSLYIGMIDYIIPAQVAYASTVVFATVLAVIDVTTARKNKEFGLSDVGLSIFRLGIELGAAIGGAAAGFLFFSNSIYDISLTSLSLEVKILVTIGTLTAIVYPIRATIELRDIFRKGEKSAVSITTPPAPQSSPTGGSSAQ